MEKIKINKMKKVCSRKKNIPDAAMEEVRKDERQSSCKWIENKILLIKLQAQFIQLAR